MLQAITGQHKADHLFKAASQAEVTPMPQKLLRPKFLARLSKSSNHRFQLIYLTVVLGAWSIILEYGYALFLDQVSKHTNLISTNHQYIGYLVFFLCIGSWLCACQKSPGCVTTQTMALFDHYPYDNALYTNKQCPTLKIRKIARSKYDRFSKRHIPRFDHFCRWLNTAVGEGNYRWFLTFLAVHAGALVYATRAMGWLLYGEILEKDLMNRTFFDARTGSEVKADYTLLFHYLSERHFEICGVLILMLVMSVVFGSFLAFHLYITSLNMTTNEFFKWKAMKSWHEQETAKYERALKDGKTRPTKNSNNGASGGEPAMFVPDGDVGCTGLTSAGEVFPDNGISLFDEILDPGPMPKNIYNNGLISNFSEVFFPLSCREDAIQRYNNSSSSSSNQSCSNESVIKPKAM